MVPPSASRLPRAGPGSRERFLRGARRDVGAGSAESIARRRAESRTSPARTEARPGHPRTRRGATSDAASADHERPASSSAAALILRSIPLPSASHSRGEACRSREDAGVEGERALIPVAPRSPPAAAQRPPSASDGSIPQGLEPGERIASAGFRSGTRERPDARCERSMARALRRDRSRARSAAMDSPADGLDRGRVGPARSARNGRAMRGSS